MLAGCNTGMPSLSAHTFTSGGVSIIFLPCGLSGWV